MRCNIATLTSLLAINEVGLNIKEDICCVLHSVHPYTPVKALLHPRAKVLHSAVDANHMANVVTFRNK